MDRQTANNISEELVKTLNLVMEFNREVTNNETTLYVKIYVTYLIKSNLEFMLQLAEKYHVTIELHSVRGYFSLLYS